MKPKSFIVFILLSFLLVNAQDNNGWKDLFNGKNLEGWRVLNGTAEFKVEDGVIIGTSKMNTPNTFLATKVDFSDFILVYEAKIDPSLNAGVQIRSLSNADYKDGRVHGYQVELDPSKRAWSGGIYDEARRGWLYHLEYNPEAKDAFKQGKWNKFRVEALENNIRVWLNGVLTADLIDDMTASGFIALQVHSINEKEKVDKNVLYKNIRIKTANLEEERTTPSTNIPQISYLKNILSDREKKEGWQLLWDGKTTQGWRGDKLDHFPPKSWSIKDGVLLVEQGDGKQSAEGGDIVTLKKYRNFNLEVDFKMTKGANSGIKYFVDTELMKNKVGSAIGCEYQIIDDEIHPDAKQGTDGNRSLASVYDLIPADARYFVPTELKAKRQNEYGWNRARIAVKGKHVEHWLNGIKQVEYKRSTPVWRALVARSKYFEWPNFGELQEGHILLQEHGHAVSFKNIKILEIGE